MMKDVPHFPYKCDKAQIMVVVHKLLMLKYCSKGMTSINCDIRHSHVGDR